MKHREIGERRLRFFAKPLINFNVGSSS